MLSFLKEKIFASKKKVAVSLFFIIALILTIIGVLYLIFSQKQEAAYYSMIQSPTIVPTIPLGKRLNFDNVFSYKDPVTFQKEKDKIVLLVPGDVIPARSVNATMVRKNDFLYPFEKAAELLKAADILFINLETPLLPDCPVTDEGMIFCGSEKAVEGLKYAGVSVANLANNHSGNYGKEAIAETVKLLGENGISVAGLQKPAILEVKGKKFGFLGFNDVDKRKDLGMSLADPVSIASEVAQLKREADFVIVTFHWGVEYTDNPTDRQKELAYSAIDAGADLIIGNHPHWVQGVEVYKNKFITYAHGNFIFDQMWSQETREGVVGKYVFGENGLIDVSFYPVVIENYSQPRFADEKEAEKILETMKKESIDLKQKFL